MVLSEHAIRKWRLATYVFTSATVVHLVLYNEYNVPKFGGKHCFTDIQRVYREWVDQNIWGLKNIAPTAESTNKSLEGGK